MKKNDKIIKKIDKKCKKLAFYILKNLKKNCKIFSFSLINNGFIVDLNVLGPSFESFEFDKKFESLLFCNEKNKEKEEAYLYRQAKGSVDVKKMEKLVVLAEYVTNLFNAIGDECELNQTKLEKLLSIANIIAMKHNYLLFENKILIKNCGLGIENSNELPLQYKGNIIVGNYDFLCEDGDGNKKEACIDVFTNVEHCELAFHESDVDDSNRIISLLMQHIVAKFYEYSALELGKQLDGFKERIRDSENSYVVVDLVKDFFSKEDFSLNNNPIYSFIFNYNF